MKSTRTYLLAILLLLAGCVKTTSEEISTSIPVAKLENHVIPGVQIAKEQIILDAQRGQWFYDGLPFSGQAVTYHTNGMLAESMGYYGGKKEGISQKWYEDGFLQKESFYRANRLDGFVRVWSPNPNRVLIVESQYENGVRHGVQKKWYATGELFKQTNINQGREEGMQQAWWKNGKLYVNYEAKNGRIFGLRKANLCYELDDEKIQFGG